MAIVVEHTPYDALYQLARQAGQAQVQSQVNERRELMKLQSQLEQRQAAFNERMNQAARAEEFQYQVALIDAKRMADLKIEASDYERQKMKLTQTLNMIRDSNDFNEREKQELSLQAMSKFAGVGQGITSAGFKQTGLQDFLTKGAYRAKLGETLQDYVDAGMDPLAAQRIASSYGLSSEFQAPTEAVSKQLATAQKRYDSALDTLRTNFKVDKKGRVFSMPDEVELKPDDPRYMMYQTASRQVEQARRDIERIYSGGEETSLQQEFQNASQQSPSLQKVIKLVGEEAAYEAWKKERSKLMDLQMKPPKFSERHPILGYYFGPMKGIVDWAAD